MAACIAMVCLAMTAGPALAQSLTDDVYSNEAGQVVGDVQSGGGNGGDSGGTAPAAVVSETVATDTGGETLPFTGFEAGIAALLGVGLLGAGLLVRHASRTSRADA